ncbi:MAG: type II toxin-antitoxin system VapC family toxin [Gammaproteobacteria bacterium]
MKYLLDTCCVSDFIKGNELTLKKIKEMKPSDLSISSISVMEIHDGLMLNIERARKIKTVIEDFLGAITVIPFNAQEAQYAGEIRAYLKNEAAPVGSYDILIAGTAISHDLVLVTSNEKEFVRVPQLKLENWRS